ncbi:iron chelate uptake ABC transporter family permease subunit [Rothia kristinae]|uniref:Iron chelate uptake ABC transporter family permease subunit n=1 Tax=Rothia kristinae TaxID=37923 RepID=A0A7T4T469_9MICC|nr:iron chelate uptake ABC transporter family permease subunit [Rothia kristinae]QQC59119.1 iron chelate uptake ABC transporter family permease subunit [Rothia kristinae]
MGSVSATRRRRRRVLWLMAAAVLLVATIAASIAFGSHALPAREVWAALTGHGEGQAATIVTQQRLPRTLLGIMCGASLAVAGAVMQALTRNPLAEPGLLGINAGASVAVVLSVVLFGALGIHAYLLFALVGAGLAAVAVYALGSGGTGRSSVVRLALAGVAISAALAALNQALILADQTAFNEFRFWVAGSLENRGYDIAAAVAPLMLLGLALAVWAAPAVNALSMGEEAGVALGVHLRRTQTIALVCVAVLAGAATAAIGPIIFVGLAVPFIARQLMGADLRWVTALSLLLGPVWLLLADVLARTILAPEETQVGIIATLVGAPVFVALMCRRKVEAL